MGAKVRAFCTDLGIKKTEYDLSWLFTKRLLFNSPRPAGYNPAAGFARYPDIPDRSRQAEADRSLVPINGIGTIPRGHRSPIR
jgi:hypothetical protein